MDCACADLCGPPRYAPLSVGGRGGEGEDGRGGEGGREGVEKWAPRFLCYTTRVSMETLQCVQYGTGRPYMCTLRHSLDGFSGNGVNARLPKYVKRHVKRT